MKISRVWASTASLVGVIFASSVDAESLGISASIGVALKALAVATPVGLLVLFLLSNRSRPQYSQPSIYLVATFFFWAALSVLWTIDVEATITALTAWAAAFCCVFLLLGLSFPKAMQSFAVAVFIVCGVSLLYALVSPNAFVENQGLMRLQGVLYGPHALARPAVIGLCVLASGVVPLRASVVRGMFLTLVLAIAMTLSRQAIAAGMASVALCVFFRSRGTSRAHLLLLGLFLVALATMLYFSADEGVASFVARGEADDVTSLTGRTFIWAAALELIQSKLFSGFGFGAGGVALQQYYSAGLYGWTTYNAHNAILQVALDLGAPGFVLCTMLLWRFLRKGFLLERKVGIPIVASVLIVSVVERGFYAVGGFVPVVFLYILLSGRRPLQPR